MSITLNSEIKKDGYLQMSYQGVYDLSDIIEVFEHALQQADENNFKYLLLDLRDLTGDSPSTMDRYELGRHIAITQQGLKSYIQIAVVGNEPMIDPERFGELVALNRGGAGKVFIDLDLAVAWIENKIQNPVTGLQH